jgi:hypothetical protein
VCHDRELDQKFPKYAGMLPPAYLSQKLAQPLPTKDGGVLRTIGNAVTYMLALPPDRGELCQRWRHATKLIPDQADVTAVSHEVHLALFYDAQLDLKAMR